MSHENFVNICLWTGLSKPYPARYKYQFPFAGVNLNSIFDHYKHIQHPISGHYWLVRTQTINGIYFSNQCMSRDMRFLKTWYVRPSKAQTSLCICAAWSEHLLIAWIVLTVKLLTVHHLVFLSLKEGCTCWVYICQNATLLEITCCGSDSIVIYQSSIPSRATIGLSAKRHSHSNQKSNLFFKSMYEPRHEISKNVVCATSKGSDQSVHMTAWSEPLLIAWILLTVKLLTVYHLVF